jgi:hypothetical protein
MLLMMVNNTDAGLASGRTAVSHRIRQPISPSASWSGGSVAGTASALTIAGRPVGTDDDLSRAEVQRLDVIFRLGEASSATIVALAIRHHCCCFCWQQFWALSERGPGSWCLGGISYPLYLVHQNAGYILINTVEPTIGKWGALYWR